MRREGKSLQVYRHNEIEGTLQAGCVLALGSFDALHIAHQQLIRDAVQYGQEYGLTSGIFLFEQRPEKVLHPQKDTESLYSSEQRIHILETMGVDFAYFAVFNETMRHMSARQFACMLKSTFDVRQICVGFHYRFGYQGEGDAQMLVKLGDELGFGVKVLEPVKLDGELVSSTRVRSFIRQGDVVRAARLLGRLYTLGGEVEMDRGVGRQMQLPTANLKVDNSLVTPANGVYSTFAYLDEQRYDSITNVGVRPTFGLHRLSIETHLLNFEGNLYGRQLRLEFVDRLRGEIRFASKEELASQIAKDIERARKSLKGKKGPTCDKKDWEKWK